MILLNKADSILLDEIHVRGDFKMGKVTNACKNVSAQNNNRQRTLGQSAVTIIGLYPKNILTRRQFGIRDILITNRLYPILVQRIQTVIVLIRFCGRVAQQSNIKTDIRLIVRQDYLFRTYNILLQRRIGSMYRYFFIVNAEL